MFRKLIDRNKKKQLNIAIKKAQTLKADTGKRYLVIVLANKFKVISKQGIKDMLKKGVFKSGLKLRDLENKAVYTTYSIV